MAKDKQSRVTEVMSALSLTGTGRRITSSLMGPGGRRGRGVVAFVGGSSSAHDAEYVEQLELGEFVWWLVLIIGTCYFDLIPLSSTSFQQHHSVHTIVKPDLSLSEYRQFHCPAYPSSLSTHPTPGNSKRESLPKRV